MDSHKLYAKCESISLKKKKEFKSMEHPGTNFIYRETILQGIDKNETMFFLYLLY